MKWAIIGNGNVVKTKSRGAFKNHKRPIERGMVRNPNNLPIAAEAYIKYSDAVYIATPPDSHLHYARIAAKHNKPTLCEKPMARTKHEAAIMASLFHDADTPLWVAYYRRCLPRFIQIKELLGKIGTIRFCCIQHTLRPEDHPVAPVIKGQPIPWRYKPEINGGGNFVDMGTHHLDLCDYFFGEIDNVVGRAKNTGGLYEAEDTVTAKFDAGEVPVVGQWCYVSGVNRDRMEIVGSNGSIEFEVFKDTPIYYRIGDTVGVINEQNPQWVHQPLVKAITDGTFEPNWESALRAMKVQELILGG